MAKSKELFYEKESKPKRDIASILDKDERFVIRNCIVYLERLLVHNTILDKKLFEILTWVLGDKIKNLGKYLFEISSQKVQEEFKGDFKSAKETDNTVNLICHLLYKSSKVRTAKFLSFARYILCKQHKSLTYCGTGDTEKKISNLAKMLNLSEQERKFVTFLYIVTAWKNAEEYFVSHLKCHAISGRKYLKTALQVTDKEINTVLSGTIIKSGLCEINKTGFSSTEDFADYFLKPSNNGLESQYFSRLFCKTIPLENHVIDQKKTEHILKLLSAKKKSSTHILLYGSPDSGKIDYAHSIAGKLGAPAYEINKKESNAVQRRAAIMACLNSTNGNKGSIIIIDEADNILKTKDLWSTRNEMQDKSWLNHFLEEPGNRIIWITNNIDQIDSSVLKRFSFSLNFKEFNKRQRTSAWETILSRHNIKKCFNKNELRELLNSYPVDAAFIDIAVKKALDISLPTKKYFKEALIMNLGAHMELVKDRDKLKNKNKIEDNYSLEGLNVEGDLPVIMKQLEAYDRFLRERDESKLRNFNLLFYGPPGTGKSELARYIANHLAREIMCKRTSDINSPWVGETEQNISKVFAKAEAEEAILIIDEADSFLFSRGRAVRSFEINRTNEFLTQMERFRGILICTTNMLEGLDSASTRRFNHKIKFDYLKPEGNIVFYQRLLAPLSNHPLDEVVEKELQEIRQLAPGDFRIVRDRFSFYEQSEINHRMLLEALSKESNIKQFQKNGGKRIGF